MTGKYRSNQPYTRARGVPTKLRRRVLRRDGHTCQIGGPGCEVEATEVDHIVPVFEGGGNELGNLRSVCPACHAVKTQEEAQRGKVKQSRQRTPMAHPTSGADGPVDWAAWGRAMGRG